MRFLERGREFLSPFGRTIGFTVRFERSGPPKICDFWGERRQLSPNDVSVIHCDLLAEREGMPEDCCVMGGCHVFWKHKKRILRTEYHMVWRSPQDLNPTWHFD